MAVELTHKQKEVMIIVTMLLLVIIIVFNHSYCLVIKCVENKGMTVKCDHSAGVVCCREGNDPTDQGKITYSQLLEQVCKFANVLKSLGLSSPV